MEGSRSRSYWRIGLTCATLGCLIVLLLLPSFRWLMVSQVHMLFTRPAAFIALLQDLGVKEFPMILEMSGAGRSDSDHRLQDVAAHHPDDLAIQIAAAWQARRSQTSGSVTETQDSYVTRLRDLRVRFPNAPSLYANILRSSTMSQIHIRRKEQEYFSSPSNGRFTYVSNVKPPDPAVFLAFDGDAARGEQLDPDNAYFPFMRAAGLYAVGRDKEALAAIHRAAGRTRWNDYLEDEAAGAYRLSAEAYIDHSALLRTVQVSAMLYPHFAQLRAAGRMTTYLAIQAEKAGDWEKGLAIRQDLMRAAAVLRAESHPIIGALVGTAIQNIAISYPGGVQMVSNPTLTDEQNVKAKREAWYSYLAARGKSEESVWTSWELTTGDQTKTLIRRGTNQNFAIGLPLFRVGLWWLADLIVMGGAFWLLATGGLSAILSHSNKNTPNIGSRISVPLICLGLLGLLSFQLARHAVGLTLIRDIQDNLINGGPNSQPLTFADLGVRLVMYAGLPVLALLIAAPILIYCLLRRIPLATGMSRGLTTAGCLLIFVYAGMLPATLRAESRLNHTLDRTLQHEGRFIASELKTTWPAAMPPD